MNNRLFTCYSQTHYNKHILFTTSYRHRQTYNIQNRNIHNRYLKHTLSGNNVKYTLLGRLPFTGRINHIPFSSRWRHTLNFTLYFFWKFTILLFTRGEFTLVNTVNLQYTYKYIHTGMYTILKDIQYLDCIIQTRIQTRTMKIKQKFFFFKLSYWRR